MRHVMIDLETLGVGRDAAIVQIGACAVDAPQLTYFSRNIKLDLSIGNIEPETLAWWLTQDGEVRSTVFDQSQAVDLKSALQELDYWLKKSVNDKFMVWSNASTFDLRLIREACVRLGIECPFNFRQEMCFRTAITLARTAGLEEPKRKGPKHDALADAQHQARGLATFLALLGGPK